MFFTLSEASNLIRIMHGVALYTGKYGTPLPDPAEAIINWSGQDFRPEPDQFQIKQIWVISTLLKLWVAVHSETTTSSGWKFKLINLAG